MKKINVTYIFVYRCLIELGFKDSTGIQDKDAEEQLAARNLNWVGVNDLI